MYKIGDFSKIVNIPVRTLRFYAECGVLVPNLVDKYTGYKYYSEENIFECELIKILKSLDFTLDEILLHKDNTAEVERKTQIKEKINILIDKYDRLSYKKNKKVIFINSEKVLRRDQNEDVITNN